ncbi:glycosyltransferase, group 1 family protein [Acinetobacter radioresistens WC-A-157]|uniref:glycosyltransferase n=1 Tax=Acinetobacter radioresistens TaxID=40216 RepID=UPI000277D83D|nr:glycosyltransferase [Acinetobacter radioresistens]EJO36165.1 glycosyltransferase, group 1 family protein [Acinetobacter radioresistens WC-A-157]
MKEKDNFFYFDFVGTFGGAQQSTSALLNFIKENSNITPIVYYVEGTSPLFLDSLKVEKEKIKTINFKKFNIFKINRQYLHAIFYYFILFISLIRKINNNSVLMCNTPKSLVLLCFLKFFKNIEVHYYCRGWGKKEFFSPVIRFFLKFMVNKVYAVSNSTAGNLIEFINTKKVFVTYTSVNLVNIDNQKNKKIDLDFPVKKIKIIFGGAIIKTKGLHTLLKSITLLPKSMQSEIIIYIAGDFKKDVEYFDLCKEIESTLYCKVYWLGWLNDMPSLIYNSDIICLPSFSEGLPRIIQEGMYLKKICISTPVGGVPDLIEHQKTGFLFEVEDFKTLSIIISEVIENKKNWKFIGENARTLILEKYNLNIQGKLFIEAFKRDLNCED